MAFQEFFKNHSSIFIGTAISTSFVLPTAGVLPIIHILDFNDSEFALAVSPGSSL